MTDQKPDPRFPDRPDSKDFWRLSDVAIEIDRKAESGMAAPDIMADLVDMQAVMYLVENRLNLARKQLDLNIIMGQAAWMDGFAIGLMFQQQGGHRDN